MASIREGRKNVPSRVCSTRPPFFGVTECMRRTHRTRTRAPKNHSGSEGIPSMAPAIWRRTSVSSNVTPRTSYPPLVGRTIPSNDTRPSSRGPSSSSRLAWEEAPGASGATLALGATIALGLGMERGRGSDGGSAGFEHAKTRIEIGRHKDIVCTERAYRGSSSRQEARVEPWLTCPTGRPRSSAQRNRAEGPRRD
jgi:hypothetical protein